MCFFSTYSHAPWNLLLSGLAYAIKDSKLDSQDQVFDCEQCKLGSQPNKGHGENLHKLLHDRGKSGVLSIPKAEDVQLERKFGKFPRNGNACSRKTQDTIVDHGVNGIREMSHKLDICPPKCAFVGNNVYLLPLRVYVMFNYDFHGFQSK